MYDGAAGKLPDDLNDESVDGLLLEDDPNAPFHDDERAFTASRRWMARSLRQYNLSLRTTHSRRGPTIDPETVEELNIRICDLLGLYEPGLVLNMDETSWKVINMNIKTIAECGADGVAC
jgi:hypothetical protein